jgi:putative transposon-encoded protein
MNFGYEKSVRRFGTSSNIDIVVYDLQGRVYRRIRQGIQQ